MSDDDGADVPRVPWEQVRDYFAQEHNLGEHVATEGPNGSGKSVLMLELLKARGTRTTVKGRPVSITILEGKARDKTITALGWKRITKISDWPPAYGDEHCVVWPTGGASSAAISRQATIFGAVLEEAFVSGNQIIYVDEAAYFETPRPRGLGLGTLMDRYWREARSNGIKSVRRHATPGPRQPLDVVRTVLVVHLPPRRRRRPQEGRAVVRSEAACARRRPHP